MFLRFKYRKFKKLKKKALGKEVLRWVGIGLHLFMTQTEYILLFIVTQISCDGIQITIAICCVSPAFFLHFSTAINKGREGVKIKFSQLHLEKW